MAKADLARTGSTIRCAIYTRKSSDEGLAQEFNSLDAQREACEAYIVSQRHAGWIAASKMKGMWMGGNVPLGYDVKDRKLIVNEPEASTVRLIFRRYAELGSVSSPVEMKSLVLDIVERVTIAANRIDIWMNRAKITAALEAGGGSQRPDIDPITLSIEAKLRRAGKGKRLVIANGAEAEVNAGLVELIKDAFTIRNRLLSGSDASIEAMSGRLGMNKCRLTCLIRLSWRLILCAHCLRAVSRSSSRRHGSCD